MPRVSSRCRYSTNDRVVVQLVDDDVVAGLQIERGGDDVLAFAGGEEESNLVGFRADESRELPSHLVGLPQHLVERDRLRRLPVGEGARGLGHGKGKRRDVRRVQIEAVAHDGEIARARRADCPDRVPGLASPERGAPQLRPRLRGTVFDSNPRSPRRERRDGRQGATCEHSGTRMGEGSARVHCIVGGSSDGRLDIVSELTARFRARDSTRMDA